MSIPKIINYCWFGGNKKPRLIEECMKSWHKYLPDYKIVEWNETNFDINSISYVKQAYEQKKWAFVTDYVRMYALYTTGGIYLDADVEILKPLDKFLVHRAFTGKETNDLTLAAVMGAEKGHPWIKMIMDWYAGARLTMTPNTQTVTQLSKPYIEKKVYDFVYLKNGVVIYPQDVFAPFDHRLMTPTPTEHSYAIHHFAGTWLGRTRI
jgi:mannosyltransferase OCH1-like enzyme